jgi:opacity protein-like surface antigen
MECVNRRGANYLHTIIGSVRTGRGPLRSRFFSSVLLAVVSAVPTAALADDEIQVYNGEIAEEGQWTAQHHLNYAPQGRTQADFSAGLVPNHTTNGTPEFAYGVTPWFEFGFYVPWAIDKDGYHSDGAKLRTLFVTPDAAKREFFYGINFEYDYFMPKFSETRFGMEIRPIVGWHFGDYEFIVNPIVDVGFGSKGDATFAPAARFARNWGEDFALAVEYYTDLGPIGAFPALNQQLHSIWGVVDFKVGRFDIEAGIGRGLTSPGSDPWITKLMITTNLFDSPAEEPEMSGGLKKPMIAKAPKKKEAAVESKAAAVVPYDFTGCYGGAYWGGTWVADIKATDPRSTGGAFFDAPFANPDDGGLYRVPFKETPITGGTASCLREDRTTRFTYGADAEAGYMRLHARGLDLYSTLFNDQLVDDTVIGDWYGSVAGRVGWSASRAFFYGKVGAGITNIRSSIASFCAMAPCGAHSFDASYSNTRAFWAAGGGIDWAWTGNWTIKMEYLYLGLNEIFAVCGAGVGEPGASTYCSNHTLEGVHTTKVVLSYKLF